MHQQRRHRSVRSQAIRLWHAEAGAIELGIGEQLDLFASPEKARLFKRRRGRPPTARAKRKYGRR
jgi:hypothetical protein